MVGRYPDRSFWGGRPVLVTGAAGFLGSWVVRHLVDLGASVTALDIDWGRLPVPDLGSAVVVESDVRDRGELAGHLAHSKAKTVIHLAAQTLVEPAMKDPVETFEHNIEGTWVVLESCRLSEHIDSVIAASSDKAYGDAGGAAYDEQMALAAMHPYAVSKAAGDLISQTYAESYGLPVGVSRCGNLFGGGDTNWSRIIPGTVRSILEGNRPLIRSDGTYVRDYLYVDDAAVGVLLMAEAIALRADLKGSAFNLASEQRFSVLEVVQKILDAMGSALDPIILDEATNEIRDQRVGASKAREVLGWQTRWGFDEALAATIEWYKSHREVLK